MYPHTYPHIEGLTHIYIYEARDICMGVHVHMRTHMHMHMHLAALGALEQVAHGAAVSVFAVVHGGELREEPVELNARAW